MSKVIKKLQNIAKKRTKKEIEDELALREQAVDILNGSENVAIAVDTSNLSHYATAESVAVGTTVTTDATVGVATATGSVATATTAASVATISIPVGTIAAIGTVAVAAGGAAISAGSGGSKTVSQPAPIDKTAPLALAVKEEGSTDLATNGMNAEEALTTTFRSQLVTAGQQAVLVGDTIELFINGESFNVAKKIKLTAEDIKAGYVDFTVNAIDFGADGMKSLTTKATDAAGNTGVASAPLEFNLDTTASRPIFTVKESGIANDNITNINEVNVRLDADIVSWKYSLDGGKNYTAGTGKSFNIADNTTYSSGAIKVQQTDKAGNISEIATNTGEIREDSSVLAPTFTITESGTPNDNITNVNSINVTLASDVASWEYSLNGGKNYTAGNGVSFNIADNTAYAVGAIKVRQTDKAGNVSDAVANTASITEDSTPLAAPTFAITDSGTPNDNITSDNKINVTLAADATSWEYSLNGGTNWTVGNGTSFNMADNKTYAAGAIQVRQLDVAGNASQVATNTVTITEDSTALAAPTFAITESGVANDNITNVNTINVTLAADATSWGYSLDGGKTYNTGSGTSFNMATDTTYAVGAIKVYQNDKVGNVSDTASNTAEIKEDSTVGIPTFAITDSGTANDNITNVNAITVSGLASDVASWEYSLDNGTNWTAGNGTTFDMASNTTYAAGAIKVRQTDKAGNVSEVATNGTAITEDSTVAAPKFAITDSGTANDNITNINTINVTEIEAGATWQYSLDGGTNWTVGNGNSFNMTDNTTYAAGAIKVRQTDKVGNLSDTATNAVEIKEDSIVANSTLSANSIGETVNEKGNIATDYVNPAGQKVGNLSNTETVTYTLANNEKFEIKDNAIFVKADATLDFETKTSYDLSLTSVDTTGNSITQTIIINVTNFEGNKVGTDANENYVGTSENDTLNGKAGNDTLNGGDGNDKFIFEKIVDSDARGGNGFDTIDNFITDKDTSLEANEDSITLTGLFIGTVNKDNINKYLHIDATIMQIDRDGDGTTYSMTNFISLPNTSILDADLANMVTAGQIVL